MSHKEGVILSFFLSLPSHLFVDALLLLELLLAQQLLLLLLISVLNELVVHFVVHKSVQHSCPQNVATLWGFILERSDRTDLYLNGLRGFQPFGFDLLITDTFEQTVILELVFHEGFDFADLGMRDSLIGQYLLFDARIQAPI